MFLKIFPRFRSLLKGSLLPALLFIHVQAFSEGTKQLEPTSAPIAFPEQRGRIHLSNMLSQSRIPFALVGCAAEYRLNIRIEDPGSETIYLGFGKITEYGGSLAPNDVSFQVKDPLGNIVPGFSMAPLPTQNMPGAIAYGLDGYNQAVAGPNISGSVPAGYNPLVLAPTQAGDYYIEFQFPNMQSNQREFETFDITVANGTTPIPGRLWSKAWQISSGTITAGANGKTYSQFYIYSSDMIVSRFDCNGLAGGVFSVFANQYGVGNTGNWLNDRKSVGNSGSMIPQYPLFLSDPDLSLYPSGVGGQLCSCQAVPSCSGTVKFLISVDTPPGKRQIKLDIPPAGPGNEDVTLLQTMYGTSTCSIPDTMFWNGLDGYGQAVPDGVVIGYSVELLNGLTNLPLFDVESNPFGIKVDPVRPLPAPPLSGSIYWDDTNISGGTSNLSGCAYPAGGTVTGCHSWNNLDNSMLNSWWYLPSAGWNSQFTMLSAPVAGPISGPGLVNEDTTGVIYTVAVNGSLSSMVWSYSGSGVTLSPAGTYSIALNFAQGATSGDLTFIGVSTVCGPGQPAILPITVLNASSSGGIVTGPEWVWEGTGYATLELSNFQGSILKWQSRKESETDWTDIFHTLPVYSLLLPDTGQWYFRTIVQNGSSLPDTSVEAVVSVHPRMLTLQVLLEGLYDPASGLMNKAYDINGARFGGDTTDLVTVEFALPAYPYSTLYVIENVALSTQGIATVMIPAGYVDSAYIVIKHRNSIETWSAARIPFNVPLQALDLTSDITSAYGSNLIQQGNKFLVYSADVNQDGLIDSSDMILTENQTILFGQGYIQEDVNGDGIIDSSDMIFIDNNVIRFVAKVSPRQ